MRGQYMRADVQPLVRGSPRCDRGVGDGNVGYGCQMTQSMGSEDMNKTVIIEEEACTGCKACVELCPQKILYIDEETETCSVTDETKCDKLRGCERVCPAGAIRIH